MYGNVSCPVAGSYGRGWDSIPSRILFSRIYSSPLEEIGKQIGLYIDGYTDG